MPHCLHCGADSSRAKASARGSRKHCPRCNASEGFWRWTLGAKPKSKRTGRPFAGCGVCGACASCANPLFAGVFSTHCPKCGASKGQWTKTPPVDKTLPDMPKGGPKFTTKAKLARDEAWQNAHEKRMEALRRLGLDKRAGDTTVRVSDGTPVHDRIRAVERAHDHRADLLAAARAGDAYAVRRADALYENWRVSERRQPEKSASGDR